MIHLHDNDKRSITLYSLQLLLESFKKKKTNPKKYTFTHIHRNTQCKLFILILNLIKYQWKKKLIKKDQQNVCFHDLLFSGWCRMTFSFFLLLRKIKTKCSNVSVQIIVHSTNTIDRLTSIHVSTTSKCFVFISWSIDILTMTHYILLSN